MAKKRRSTVPHYSRDPMKLKTTKIGEVWAYEDVRGLKIYADVPGVGVIETAVTRQQIHAYLRRDNLVRSYKKFKKTAKHPAS